MKGHDKFLILGLVLGCIMWGSLTTLVENNGIIAIVGLMVSSMLLGFGLGLITGRELND